MSDIYRRNAFGSFFKSSYGHILLIPNSDVEMRRFNADSMKLTALITKLMVDKPDFASMSG